MLRFDRGMKSRVISLRQPAPAEPRLSDEAVALACGTRDPAAIAELFDRFRVPVTRFLARVVYVKSDIEDLVQATFLEVARGHARFDGRSAVSTWIIGIAANVTRHHLRSAGRQRRLRSALAEVHDSTPPSAPGVAEARVDLERVRRILADQSTELRLAFVLCEVEGLSAKEAAAVLATTETAVWKRVSDVRRALRRAIEGGAP